MSNQKLIETIETELNRGLLPQTDFTHTIPVTVYDAKVFIGRIQSQIEIMEVVNKTDEAKHWQALLEQAKGLFKL